MLLDSKMTERSEDRMDPELEAENTLDALNRCAVNYVVIGAFAPIAQDVPVLPTMDIDFYATSD